jgi:hypothetical protein
MVCNSFEDISEVCIRIDTVHFSGFGDGVDAGGALAADRAPIRGVGAAASVQG